MTTLTTDKADAPQGELLTAGIATKLRGLRRALRGRLLAEGAAWFVVAMVTAVLATLALDYLLRLDRPLRAVVMAVAAAGAAWVVWRQLVGPMLAAMGQAELALLIERRYPHLQSRLISAVQFHTSGVPAGESAAMVAQMAAEANDLAGELDFSPVVERASMWRVVKIALCAAGLLAGLAVWRADVLRLWAMRNLALADVPWPQNTYLTVEGGPDFPVLRGDDLTVEVTVEPGSAAPSYITLHAWYPSVGWTEDRVRPSANGQRKFDVVFRSVSEPVEFYVVGGDDRRDKERPHHVTLVDPPALRDVAFTIEYPSYMQREPLRAGGAGSVVSAPVGGSLRVSATATKDITAASVSLTGLEQEVSVPLRVERTASPGGSPGRPRRLLGTLEIAGANEPEVRTLQFHLTDSQGYGNRHGGKYFLRVEPDLAPGVDLKKTDVGPAVTPNAIVPLLVAGKDDSGIAGGLVKLTSLRGSAAGLSEPLAIATEAEVVREFALRHEMDLEGLGMIPGDRITIVAEVADILPGELGGPNVGTSGAVALRIVRADKLLDELVTRQRALSVEFVQAIEQQESARVRTTVAADMLAEQSAVTPEALAKLTGSAGQQQSVSTEVSKAAEKLSAILTEMTYNRLGDPADRQDLATGIIEPLREVYEASEGVATDLAEAKTLPDVGAMQAAAERIAADQRDLRQQMSEILARMEKLQSRQDLANKLQTIIRSSQKTLTGIRRREQEEVRGIWNP